jgi:hypothetical protein
MRHSWFHWRRRHSVWGAYPTCPTRSRRSFVPQLLVLEDRTLLSVLTVLSNADSGVGSLRDTIAAAQSGDTIVFDPSLAYETITLSSGPLAISSNLTIAGPSANLLTISGNKASQLFTLSGSAQVTLSNLTLTGGISNQGGAVFIGGKAGLALDSDVLSGNQAVGDTTGNAFGGAVYTSPGASLTINNTSFVNNQANGTTESFGGAIANAGSLTITDATFTGNAVLGSTTAIGSPAGGNQGGAIGNLDGSTSSVQLSTFTNNLALGTGAGDAAGGAIGNQNLSVFPFTGSDLSCTLFQCTFTNNLSKGGSNATDGGFGGAIENQPGVNLTVRSCAFTGNQANSGGGSLVIGGAIGDSVADLITVSDSQFISNAAIGSGVGALALGGALNNWQTMTIVNSFFTGNQAIGGPMADGVNTLGQAQGGAIETGDGLPNNVLVTLTLSNSIVADNEAIGGSGGSTLIYPRTDIAGGGGIANGLGGTLNVSACTITGNESLGGDTVQGSGGLALGGGIENQLATLNLMDSTVSTNLCQGGAGAAGYAGGIASGAGIDNSRGAIAILANSIFSLNEARGGAGGAGASGGAAVGGGLANAVFAFAFGSTDASSLIVSNCQLIGNRAQGGTEGSSAVGGDGLGGGLFVGSGTAVLQGVLVCGNQASNSDNDVWGTITIGP